MMTELHHIKLGVGKNRSSTEACTSPDQDDVAKADGLAVSCPRGVDNDVVSVKSNQANTAKQSFNIL